MTDSADTSDGDASQWPGWRSLNEAASSFLVSVNTALENLEGLAPASAVVKWLEEDVSTYAEDLHEKVLDCEDDLSSAVEMVEELQDEAEEIEELLSFLDEVEDSIADELGENTSDLLRDQIVDFVVKKLRPVKKSGWNLYHVLLQAA